MKKKPNPILSGPQFKTSDGDRRLLDAIVDRAVKLVKSDRLVKYDRRSIDMDLTACHVNGCALDLPGMLAASDADFSHDLYGIRRFLDRSTGKMSGIFHPRLALPEKPPGKAAKPKTFRV